ncbi:aminoacyl-tRNA hydrolase [Amphiplicatus metriothermophilus]|uniref:Peptidyl-tRNA hydrolase n=1 Tax=Amphiplicatus metriothermophilus TaxID=1519374 RepID=A0A239PU68_9PROT|nr:aminoacyl-tRNA hydrolase [Amphiplicatus metriothermophilus]MBB5519466.1 PTH1 family peptidyl-tRNA hydrolase [Amphiplicatus metriothermophilus]SNT73678.1 peptidyl-tRNA hydrolase [Amphiplicatus metriothermophilus]
MSAKPLLLVGLGNPGAKYARHRHNVGFMAVDAVADVHGFSPPRAKFQGELREGFLDSPRGRIKAIVLKPLTYMNESGRSVGEAMRFFRLQPADVVVFHDELDLAPGKVKAKTGGGTAGHNGLKSIAAHIGPDFRRVRIGIGHPGDKARVTGHVLGDFARADQEWLAPLLAAVAAAAPALAEGDARFTSALAQRLQPPRGKDAPAAARQAAPRPTEADKKKDATNPFAKALGRLLGRDGGARGA